MKSIFKTWFLVLAGVFLAAPAVGLADDSANTAVGIAQGGSELFVKSGGKIDIQSGGELEISSGATLDINAVVDFSNAASVELPICNAIGDTSQLCYVDVTIATAEVLALNATPIELVAAPGAGLALIYQGAQFFLDYATTAYDGVASGEDLSVKYTNASGAEVAQIETTGFIDQGADELRYSFPISTAAIEPVANAALVLHLLVGEIATGDSPLKARVYYKVVPSTL